MSIEVRPAADFEDLKVLLGPRREDANVCWCLSYRLDSATNRSLRGPARGAYMGELMAGGTPLGVLAYDGSTPVGWAALAPRSATAFARNRTIPHLDDSPVWSLWCLRVRPGHRRQGISHELIAGAVEHARTQGAPAVEAYPLDNKGERVDLTMAYPGLRANFEAAGFTVRSTTSSVLAGHHRVLMRRDLD